MLIDDEPIDLFINEKLLTSQGFAGRYQQYQEAMAALDELQSRIDKGRDLPDMIFLDYFMPQIDGLDFLTRLREMEQSHPEAFSELKVIMLTTLKAPEKRRNLHEFDRIFRIMSKPLSERSIKDLIESLGQQAVQ